MSDKLNQYNLALTALVHEAIRCIPESWHKGVLTIDCNGNRINYKIKNEASVDKASISDELARLCEQYWSVFQQHGEDWLESTVEFYQVDGSWKFNASYKYPPKQEQQPQPQPQPQPQKIRQPSQVIPELATRMQRFWAALIDGLLYSVPSFIVTTQLGLVEWPKKRGDQIPMSAVLVITVFCFAFFLLFNYKHLKSQGQTIGKRALKIKIVDHNNQVPDIQRLILRRQLLPFLLNPIPVLGKVFACADALFVIRRSRACLHDVIAGTKVVKVSNS